MVNGERNNGFGEFKQLFLKMIDDVEKLRESHMQLRIEQAVMKVKIAFWGGVGATVATGIFNMVLWFIRDYLIHKP